MTIVAVAFLTFWMARQQESSGGMDLSRVATGDVTAKVELAKWYVINRLTPRWVKQEQRNGEIHDIYEVTGEIRKKYVEVPDVATIIVKSYVGLINISTESRVVRGVTIEGGQAFTIEISDPTQARKRGENLVMQVSAHTGD
jgi:hypothetical protein